MAVLTFGIGHMNPNDFVNKLSKIPNLEITWHQITDCPTTPEFFFFLCELKFQEISATGTGESFLSNFAKLKSTAEALERWSIQNPRLKWKNHSTNKLEEILNHTTSNGVAFHLTEKEALQSATGELIERDAVLKAYHKQTRPYRFSSPFKWKIINILNKWKYKLDDVYFLLFPTEFNEFVVACVIEKDTFPYRIFGYGHSTSFEKSIEKSWSEAWRFFWNLLHCNSIPEKRIEEIDSPLDHLYYHAQNPINIQEIFHIQKDSPVFPTSDCLVPDCIWSAQLADHQIPGNVFKVHCEKIQNLYFGMNATQDCKIHPIG